MTNKTGMVSVTRNDLQELIDGYCGPHAMHDRIEKLLCAPAEDVRAVVNEPVGYAGLNGLNTLRFRDGYLIVSVKPGPYLDIPLYRRPQRKVVMPERKPESYSVSVGLIPYHEGWNACLDEFERLNK